MTTPGAPEPPGDAARDGGRRQRRRRPRDDVPRPGARARRRDRLRRGRVHEPHPRAPRPPRHLRAVPRGQAAAVRGARGGPREPGQDRRGPPLAQDRGDQPRRSGRRGRSRPPPARPAPRCSTYGTGRAGGRPGHSVDEDAQPPARPLRRPVRRGGPRPAAGRPLQRPQRARRRRARARRWGWTRSPSARAWRGSPACRGAWSGSTPASRSASSWTTRTRRRRSRWCWTCWRPLRGAGGVAHRRLRFGWRARHRQAGRHGPDRRGALPARDRHGRGPAGRGPPRHRRGDRPRRGGRRPPPGRGRPGHRRPPRGDRGRLRAGPARATSCCSRARATSPPSSTPDHAIPWDEAAVAREHARGDGLRSAAERCVAACSRCCSARSSSGSWSSSACRSRRPPILTAGISAAGLVGRRHDRHGHQRARRRTSWACTRTGSGSRPRDATFRGLEIGSLDVVLGDVAIVDRTAGTVDGELVGCHGPGRGRAAAGGCAEITLSGGGATVIGVHDRSPVPRPRRCSRTPSRPSSASGPTSVTLVRPGHGGGDGRGRRSMRASAVTAAGDLVAEVLDGPEAGRTLVAAPRRRTTSRSASPRSG